MKVLKSTFLAIYLTTSVDIRNNIGTITAQTRHYCGSFAVTIFAKRLLKISNHFRIWRKEQLLLSKIDFVSVLDICLKLVVTELLVFISFQLTSLFTVAE